MKLIDLLVKELPKRGGWPDGAEYCHLTQYDRHCLTIVFSHSQVGTGGNNPITSREEMVFSGIGYLGNTLYDCTVTYGQYESALAESQEPVWSGEGLPPVGMHCKIVDHDGVLMYGQGESGEVIAHVENTAVIRMSYGLGCFEARYLRPIRTEADKKRDAFINAVPDDMRTIPCDLSLRDEVAVIYDAIAAGKIPGVKLDD